METALYVVMSIGLVCLRRCEYNSVVWVDILNTLSLPGHTGPMKHIIIPAYIMMKSHGR